MRDDWFSLYGVIFCLIWEYLCSDIVGFDGLLGIVDVGNVSNYGIEFGG